MNVLKEQESVQCSIDWSSKVEDWSKIKSPEEEVYLCSRDEAMQDVVDVKSKKMNNLKSNEVFEDLSYIGSTCPVITEKYKDGKKITKAILVARGLRRSSQI